MKVVIIKYNAGNTRSVYYAIKRMGIEPVLTDDPDVISSADKVIFPGVGEASSTMNHFRSTGLDKLLPGLKQPVLGVCLGLQLMCSHSEEGDTKGLNIFDVRVRKFDPQSDIRIPHMGWNNLHDYQSPLFNGFDESSHVYFVHGFFAELSDQTSSKCTYGIPFSASFEKDNFYAVQFHPEKSGKTGALLLENFMKL